jgi:hypothetical protein
LREAYQRFDRTYPAVLGHPDPPAAPDHQPPPYIFQCDRMKVALRVNEYGDGHQQMSLQNVRVARMGQKSAYELLGPTILFGQVSPFQLQARDSSPGISVAQDEAGRLVANFDPAPSAERPQNLILETLGAHVFAMDRKELAFASAGQANRATRFVIFMLSVS